MFSFLCSAVVLCVPNIYDADGVNHRKRVVDDLHTSEYSGHRGENTTVVVITKRFWWNDITKEVIKYLPFILFRDL